VEIEEAAGTQRARERAEQRNVVGDLGEAFDRRDRVEAPGTERTGEVRADGEDVVETVGACGLLGAAEHLEIEVGCDDLPAMVSAGELDGEQSRLAARVEDTHIVSSAHVTLQLVARQPQSEPSRGREVGELAIDPCTQVTRPPKHRHEAGSIPAGSVVPIRGALMPDPWPFLAPVAREASHDAEQPTFSVIVAAYQVAAMIGDALESALHQSAPPAEIIVCDDGSTDALDEALEPYRSRVRLVRQPNRGEAAAKNAAARVATSDFVVILDADDLFAPERLAALQWLAMRRPDLDVQTTDAWLELDGTRIRRCYNDAHRFEVDDQRAEILRRNFVFGLAAVRRRRFEAVGGFDEAIRRTTDWDLWIRLIHSGSQVGLVAEPLASYRVRPQSLSADRAGMARGGLATLEKARRTLTGLPRHERGALSDGIARERAKAVEREARIAVRDSAHDVRRRLLALAVTKGIRPASRAKAVAAAVLPSLARRQLARAGTTWTGAGDVATGSE
jgi:hypothetical protein